ncbi:hypothetical protein GCM10010160_75310 [Acrocarpospora corrugata]
MVSTLGVGGVIFAAMLHAADADTLQPVTVPSGMQTQPAPPEPTIPPSPDNSMIVNFEPPLEALPQLTSLADAALPLDAYRLSPEQAAIRNPVWLKLEQNCMAGFGLEGIVGSRIRDVPSQSRVAGHLSVVTAREKGYQPTAAAPPVVDLPVRTKLFTSADTQAATGIFTGSLTSYQGKPVPQGGCRQAASDIINAGVGSFALDPSDLAFSSGSLTTKDSRVLRAAKGWADCMAKAGLSYQSPEDAAQDPRWMAGERGSAAEKTAATADAQCRVTSDLSRYQVAVESAYQKVLISRHQKDLERVREQIAKQVENAVKAAKTA